MGDSTSIEDAAAMAGGGGGSGGERLGLRDAVLLLVTFLLVCSDYFVNHILVMVPAATRGREVTNRGVLVQGVCLVLAYALVSYLVAENFL